MDRGKAWAGARHGQWQGKGKGTAIQGRARQALLYIYREERYTRGRVSLFSIERMQTPSPYRTESVSTRYREGTDPFSIHGRGCISSL